MLTSHNLYEFSKVQFLEKIELVPIFIPNNLENVSKFLDDVKIEGLIISGGDNLGEHPQRDSTEKSLLEYSIKNKIPITESNLEKNLYTSESPNPDILIRTGNTNRLSNFLLWQTAYSEIFFVKKLWPDFNTGDFKQIINKFKNIKRNFGSV